MLPAAAPSVPSATPDLAQTGIAQTQAAIPLATFTASPLPPTFTPTITLTFFPTITPWPTATPTATETPFGFKPSPTPGLDLTELATTPQPSDFSCEFISKSPDNWEVVKPRASFDARWTLKNDGLRPWPEGIVSLVHVSGSKMSGDKQYELPKDVKPGEQIVLAIDLIAPKDEGAHAATWGLKMNRLDQVFCQFTVKILVRP